MDIFGDSHVSYVKSHEKIFQLRVPSSCAIKFFAEAIPPPSINIFHQFNLTYKG